MIAQRLLDRRLQCMLLLRDIRIEAVIQTFLETDTPYSTRHVDYTHFIVSSFSRDLIF